ncbi:Uncharacterized conserved protein, DUF1697 family [Paenimyroides ummariense]|uniref:Uncharacterized conserved protein, DUF1697 family n=1 Tax=Paenimyroides ummariense TaxID=913024 RepID=A0A1I5BAR1_9FLAO|nr:DUF1697 domain-containing protein [Paenimyroides ummariense]SFN71786.1 Uncharacterized conserved protein, DUF1697 family [Paenimyroides ummariense]
MKTYIVLLRGVNVSGKNIIKMAILKDVLIDNNFKNVATYIQSGNIILSSDLEKHEVETKIQQLIYDHFQLQIAVFCLDLQEMETALQNNPFIENIEPNKLFFTFLNEEPAADLLADLEKIDFANDQFKLIDKVLYFYLSKGMANSKLNNNFFEKKLKVTATGRNLNTIHKLIDLAKNSNN